MRTMCLPRGCIFVPILFLGFPLALIGCSDNSRTTGTMVEMSDEAKAFLKSKQENYRGGSAKNKARMAAKKSQPAAKKKSGRS